MIGGRNPPPPSSNRVKKLIAVTAKQSFSVNLNGLKNLNQMNTKHTIAKDCREKVHKFGWNQKNVFDKESSLIPRKMLFG